jgi:hypothetical protein
MTKNKLVLLKTRKLSSFFTSPKCSLRHIGWILVSNLTMVSPKRLYPFDSISIDPYYTSQYRTTPSFCFSQKAFVPILHRIQNWSPSESSPLVFLVHGRTPRWAIPLMQGAARWSQMISQWMESRARLILTSIIENGIPRCEFCPSRLPTEASTAQYFEAVWNLNKKQSNNAAKLKSFRLWCRQRVFGIVCLKGCLPSLQLTVMVSMVHGGQQGQGSRSSDQNT